MTPAAVAAAARAIALAVAAVTSPAPATPSPATPSPHATAAPTSASAGTFAPAPVATFAPSLAPNVVPTALLEDPTVSAKAREWLLRLQSDNLDRRQIDAKFNAAITPPIVKSVSTRVANFGTLVSFTFRSAAAYPEGVVYVYNAQFTFATANWYFAIDNEGKIGGMQLLTKDAP